MKIMIVSDTHNKHENLKRAVKQEAPLDLMIHLGDAEGQEYEIGLIAECPLEIVSGNNDFFSYLAREKELTICGFHILITHGHYYYVSTGIEKLKREARGRDMDIVMFGHTHRPLLHQEKTLITLNPGSISYPRQDGKEASYAILRLEDSGVPEFTLKYLPQA